MELASTHFNLQKLPQKNAGIVDHLISTLDFKQPPCWRNQMWSPPPTFPTSCVTERPQKKEAASQTVSNQDAPDLEEQVYSYVGMGFLSLCWLALDKPAHHNTPNTNPVS